VPAENTTTSSATAIREHEDAATAKRVMTVDQTGNYVSGGGVGGDGAILDGVSSAIKATVKNYANSKPVAVVSVDTNGDYVAAGGGTQYADGAVRGTSTGTLAMVDDGTNIQSMSGDATGKPNVNVSNTPTVKISQTTTDNDVDVASIAAGDNNIGNVDVVTLPAVTGTVTANAGTNLNTSALALEAGGNLAGINAKLVTGTDIGDVTINNSTGVAAVNIQDGGNTITVDGTVTANAGTNLNTSALALEAGGNLAAAATSLAVIDDWDESDRAKVNPIAGQTGVQGNSGVVTALTQRVTQATDVPVNTTPLPSGKTDKDLKFSLSVATGAQTSQTIDNNNITDRAVKEIYVAANGFGEGAYVRFYRGAVFIGEMYLIAKNFLVRDVLTYSTSELICDINTGNSGTITVYFNVKYYE
jgi:hypothetical protein